MAEYGSHSVTIETDDITPIVKLGGITAMGMPLNVETVRDDSGSLYDSFGAISFQAPRPQFTTKAVAAALAVIPQAGICLTDPGIKLYGESKGDCQVGEPGSGDHLEYTVDLGLVVPLTLSGSRRDDITLSVEVDAITDGVNAPFAADYTATLPTGYDTSVYVMGAMRIGNILWDDVRSFNLDFGVERIESEPQLGGVWPDRSGRRKARPTCTLTARNPTKLDDSTGIPLLGKEATHANTIFYFKKRKNRATFELDAAAVHFNMTMAGLVYFDTPFSSTGTAPAETTLRIQGIHDGTNTPLLFNFNTTYDPTP